MGNPNDINAEFYDLIYADEKGEAVTSAECTMIAGLAGEPPNKILDVGAGTGRHAIRLAEMGYKVTAIDLSKGMLDILAKRKIPNIKTIYADIYKYKTDERFDVIILMWNVFNEIALTKKDAKRLINQLTSMLNPDGKILINIEKVPEDKPYIPEFIFEKKIKSLGDVKVEWTNVCYNKRTNTTISKEQIYVNEKAMKPALIKQRWWRNSDLKIFIFNRVSYKYIVNKLNAEIYISIQTINY